MTIDIHFLFRYRLHGNASEITLHSVIQYSSSCCVVMTVASVLRLVAALTHAVNTVAAVTDGAVHADLLARVVLALGSAHHRSCGHRHMLKLCMYFEHLTTFTNTISSGLQDTLYNCNEHSYNEHIQIFAPYRPHRRWLISLVLENALAKTINVDIKWASA